MTLNRAIIILNNLLVKQGPSVDPERLQAVKIGRDAIIRLQDARARGVMIFTERLDWET